MGGAWSRAGPRRGRPRAATRSAPPAPLTRWTPSPACPPRSREPGDRGIRFGSVAVAHEGEDVGLSVAVALEGEDVGLSVAVALEGEDVGLSVAVALEGEDVGPPSRSPSKAKTSSGSTHPRRRVREAGNRKLTGVEIRRS
ncbi:hypothetical protein [Streptomyces sp. NPDC007905]|uniref:hypothetical protein n=1 Tax=Streptomyces sp. NPDC007905 TaxID=3364788 RepID=UPI0036E10E68